MFLINFGSESEQTTKLSSHIKKINKRVDRNQKSKLFIILAALCRSV